MYAHIRGHMTGNVTLPTMQQTSVLAHFYGFFGLENVNTKGKHPYEIFVVHYLNKDELKRC